MAPPTAFQPERFLSVKEVAGILRVSEDMVYRLLKMPRGQGVRGCRIGRHYRIRYGDVMAYAERGGTPPFAGVHKARLEKSCTK